MDRRTLKLADRTRDIVASIVGIWSVPVDHKSGFSAERAPVRRKRLKIVDLIAANALQAGAVLTPRRKPFATHCGTVLLDGRIELDGQTFNSPSVAAEHLVGHPMNGWWFFLVAPRRSLAAVRREYLESLYEDDEEDDDEAESEDED